jgi:hypothetical protein
MVAHRIEYLLLAFFIFVFGCSSSKEVIKDDIPAKDVYKYDESFDPLSLNDDDILIDGNDDGPVVDNSQTVPDTEEDIKLKEITGFRVQIFATKDIETASLFELEASERFSHLDHKIYLIFETPLYKIRVGDCKDRSQAEELRDLATQYGYRESFIVKSKVQVQE